MSKGMPNKPRRPITENATKMFGNSPISMTLNDLKIRRSINAITTKTNVKDPICD
jgi:hypothetical protein